MLLTVLSTLSPAFAQDLVKYETQSAVTHGKETASVTFTVNVDGTFGFSMDCGVRSWKEPTQSLGAGSQVVMKLQGLPKGEHSCMGSIEVDSAHGSGTLTFRQPFASLDGMDWSATTEDVDLEKRTAQPTCSRPLKYAEAEIISIDRDRLGVVQADLSDPRRPLFRWNFPDEVLTIKIVGEDTSGFRGSLDLSPWSYEIPHDDLVFATGSDVVTGSESKKLEATWGDIQGVIEKYGDYVPIQLYVAGYTDTVGDRASNQALSQRRARSIARWFKERGFPGDVHSQGFGESVLAKATPDETDEEANRRAVYILAASPPRTSSAIPRSNWNRE